MYEALSASELVVLQDMLYAATEEAYRVANLLPDSESWISLYSPVHAEVAPLCLEAAHELLGRLRGAQELAHA